MDPFEFCDKFPAICNDELLDDQVLLALIEAIDHELYVIGGFEGPFPTLEHHSEIFHTTLRSLIPAIATHGGLYADELAYEVARAVIEGIEEILDLEEEYQRDAQFKHYVRGLSSFTTADWILFIDTMIPPQVGDISQSLHRSMRFLWKHMGSTTADFYSAFRNLREMQKSFSKYAGFMRSLHTPKLRILAQHLHSFDPTDETHPWTDAYITYVQDLPLKTKQKHRWMIRELFQQDFKPKDTQVSYRSTEIYPGQERDVGRIARLRFIPKIGDPITLEGKIKSVDGLTLSLQTKEEIFVLHHNGTTTDTSSIEGSFDFLMVKNRISNYLFDDFLEDLFMSYSREHNPGQICPFIVGD